MDAQDKKISQLYRELNSNIHASAELKERVITMTEKTSKKRKVSFRVVCVAAALTVLASAIGIGVSASKENKYDKIIINGVEKQAKFRDFENNTRVWCYENDDASYWAYVYGDFDKEKDTLYFIDYGDYFLASTDPNPTLNLYTDIDKFSNAYITETNGEKTLCITDGSETMEIFISEDDKDGVVDGKLPNGDVYTLLPNGSVVNTLKAPKVKGMDQFFGNDSKSRGFWNGV